MVLYKTYILRQMTAVMKMTMAAPAAHAPAIIAVLISMFPCSAITTSELHAQTHFHLTSGWRGVSDGCGGTCNLSDGTIG